MDTMKALYYDGARVVLQPDRPVPAPAEGESLIRVNLAAVCNTDKEVARGYKAGFRGVMGHEFVGVVADSPNRSLVGRRVVGELNAGCGRCLYCRTGREHHCETRRVIGMQDKDGCFAEYLTLRTDLLHPVPDTLQDRQAIYTEPLAAALEILDQCHIPPSTSVAVLGDGRLAYLIAQVAALTGAELTVVGRHPDKLAAFAPFAHTTTETGDTYEIVIDATGSPSGIEAAAELVRPRGLVVLKSTYAGSARVDMSRLVVNEVTLTGSRCGPFAPALRLLERGLLTLPDIALFPLEDHAAAFASPAFKAGFRIG